MSGSATAGLGPQCLACKRRQVKCDSTPIACKRCQKDDIPCPGYKKPLKWNHFQAPRRPGAKLQRIKSESSEDGAIELIRRNPRQDREFALVLDSVDYFNKHVVPYSPAHAPFRRHFIPADLWPLVPTALKFTLIVFSKTNQCDKALCDPILNSDLIHYRGRSLSHLQKLLSDTDQATTDPHAVALFSVIFMMGADMQLCEEHWTTHLEAARRIIFSRGGLQKVLLNPLIEAPPIINYVYADILTATACNAWSLNSRAVQSQFEYLSIIPQLEAQLVSAGHPCPEQILRAIICSNILRVQAKRPLTSEERRLMTLHVFDFEKIHDMIITFDSDIWAIRLSGQARTLPQRAEDELADLSITCLASVAECFKSAALLYLILSTQIVNYHEETILSAKEQLSFHLRLLFDNASVETDGPLHSRLWIFTIWPIFISAYANAGWDLGEESMEIDFNRVNAVMKVFPAGRVSDIEKLIRSVHARRLSMSSAIPWSWDDAFTNRCGFVV